MKIVYLFLGIFLVLLVLERFLLRSLLRRNESGLTFPQYFLIGIYKPGIIIVGILIYSLIQDSGLLPVLVLLFMGLVTVLISYPISRSLYKKRFGEKE